MIRRCLGCRRLISSGSYCGPCRQQRRSRTGWAWGEIRNAVRARDRVCVKCGRAEGLEVHHRVALVDGGTNALSNLELLCRRCHHDARAYLSKQGIARVF